MRSELNICCRAESVYFGRETHPTVVQAALCCADMPNFQLFANTLLDLDVLAEKLCLTHKTIGCATFGNNL